MTLNYDEDEGRILGAINLALGGDWWDELSEGSQEAVHDALFNELNREKQ